MAEIKLKNKIRAKKPEVIKMWVWVDEDNRYEETDFYNEDGIDEMIEEGELSPEEGAFMVGWLATEEKLAE